MQRNFFLKIVLSLSFLCASIAPAAAFTSADNVNASSAFGSCRVERRLSSSGGDGAVSIVTNAPLTYYDAGGSYFTFGYAMTSTSITASQIASCLGTTLANVAGLAQNGANGAYTADTYMGFYFTLGTASGGLTAGTHHFYVGDVNAAPGANTPAVITFTNPVSSVPVTSDVVTFSVSDVDTANILVTSYAFTTGACDASLSFFGGPTVTIIYDNTNGQYICARVNDGTVDTFLRSTSALNINNPPSISITNDVAVGPVTSDTFSFYATDPNVGPVPTSSYAFTSGACNSSLSFSAGSSVTVTSDATNGQYICARASDPSTSTYRRSANVLHINNPPVITITDDVSATAVPSDTFAFSAADPNIGDSVTTGFAITSGACDASLSFTTGTSIFISDKTNNGQYICATASDGINTTYRRSSNALIINNLPVIAITDDVSATPGTSDTFVFSASDIDAGDSVTTGYAVTSGTCDASLTFISGGSVTFSDDTRNGVYICAMANDGTSSAYQRSTNVLNINNLPVINITDDVSAVTGASDTFAFSVTDVDAGDTPVSGYALTSAACDASLSFTSGNSVTISDGTTNGQYICAMTYDGTAHTYLRSTNVLNVNDLPVITITDDVSAGAVTSDTFAFSATDANIGDTVTTGYSLTSAACDASLSFTTGDSVTVSDDMTNGQYICAMAYDDTANTYLRSSNALNINNDPSLSITDDVSATPGTSDTFAFSASDVDSGDTVTTGYSLTSAACDASLSFISGNSVTISDDTTNGQYICAMAHDGTANTYLRSTNALNINNLPVITITDDVSAMPVTSDTFAFTIADVDAGDTPVGGFALTSSACDASLSFTPGNNVTISDDTANGQYICAMANDGTANTYLRSANALNINNLPVITITDDVSATPVTSDTFAFSITDVDAGDTPVSGYALTSAACDASLSFTTGSSVTISDDTTNGQYICAMANDGTANTYLRSSNALNINNAPAITITDDVSATPGTSDTFAFTASDIDAGDSVTTGYALTSAVCDASLSFAVGSSVTISDDTTNGQYICAMASDGTAAAYLRSTNALDINNLPVITITDDVSAVPVMSDTFAFTIADVDSGDTPVSGYALTSAACDASLSFTASNSVTISDDTTNGQYICAMANDGTANTYLRSSNTLNIDLIQPTVTITDLPTSISGTIPVDITVSFSEAVTGFDTADIDVTGASVSLIADGPAVYTVTLLPAGNTDLVVSILADAAADEAGNLNLASEIVTITNTLPTETSELIANFMQARARNLIASQPSLLGVNRGGGHFNANLTSRSGGFDFSSDMSHPIWLQMRGNWSSAGTQTDQYVLGVLGTHYQPTENLSLGVMAQFDDARSVDGVAKTAGWGWLVGPYVVAQHPNQPLYFEASALYGQSYNTVSPLDTFSDDFTTDRLLATSRLTGEYDTGRMVLFPNIGLVYASDHQHEYTDSVANVIAAQSVSMTDFSAALDFELPLNVQVGQLILMGGVSAHYMAVGGDAVGVSPYDGYAASTELGLSYDAPGGARYSGSARYEGIGNSGYEAYSVTFELSVPF